jgi:hypothetical protein
MSRIAIIGAGPIGLEAALLARQLGHDVHVFEKGCVAENILDWGHVRLFSPFGMNSSEWGRGAIAKAFGSNALPHDDELLTGREFAERYLIPLSQLPELTGRIQSRTEVVSIGRRDLWKSDAIGNHDRSLRPLRLLIQHHPQAANGNFEAVDEANVVLDCSGTYPHHNWLGPGGTPSIGEQAHLNNSHYRLPEICPEQFSNRRTLVVGDGFSAATAVVALSELAKTSPRTQVVWVTRRASSEDSSKGPLPRIPNDPLPERARLTELANSLALKSLQHNSGAVEWLPGRLILIVNNAAHGDGFQVLTLEQKHPFCETGVVEDARQNLFDVDRIIANVGYRPDRSIYEELHVHECYATQGPIKLAAKLLGETSSDCLAQTSHGCDVLKNPEPNFFILGSKSYGRNSNFLLKVGIEQVREVLQTLNPT